MPKGAEDIFSRVTLLISGQKAGDMPKGLSPVNAYLYQQDGVQPQGHRAGSSLVFVPPTTGDQKAHVPELVRFAGTAEGSSFGKRPRIWGRGAAIGVRYPAGLPGATVCFGLG